MIAQVSPRKVLPKARSHIRTKGDRQSGGNVESALLQDLKRRRDEAIARGERATLWSVFAPMVNIQTSGTVKPFVPYEYQIDFIEAIENGQNVVIGKGRQLGASESLGCYLLMRSLTEPGFSAVIFSKTQADSSELGRRIRDMAVSLGSLCPPMESESATKLVFKGLGRIHLLPVTARAARGIPSVSVVVFDEAAFIDGVDGVYQAAMPTLSMLGDKGKVIFNSTPNGKAGLFYRLLTGGVGEAKRVTSAIDQISKPVDAQNNIVPFLRQEDSEGYAQTAKHTRIWTHRKWTKVLLHWRAHPIYGADPDWARKTREDRKLTEAQWAQEYELDFGLGSNAVFKDSLIEKCAIATWQPAMGHRRYMASIDPAFGGEDDFTVQVWDVTHTPSLVAEWAKNRSSGEMYLQGAIALLDEYRPVMMAIETNGGGELYAQEFVKALPWLRVERVCTSNTSKLVNSDRLVLMHEQGDITYPPDSLFAEQLPHFIEVQGGKGVSAIRRTRAAESGHKDDSVMAGCVMAAWIDEARVMGRFTSIAGASDGGSAKAVARSL